MSLGFPTSVPASDSWLDKASQTEAQRISRRRSFASDAIVIARASRPRLSAWGKVKEVWSDLDVVGLTTLTIGCGLFLLPFTLAANAQKHWADREYLRPPSRPRDLSLSLHCFAPYQSRDLDAHPVRRGCALVLRLVRVKMGGSARPASSTFAEPHHRLRLGTRLLSLRLAILVRELFHQLSAVSMIGIRTTMSR